MGPRLDLKFRLLHNKRKTDLQNKNVLERYIKVKKPCKGKNRKYLHEGVM